MKSNARTRVKREAKNREEKKVICFMRHKVTLKLHRASRQKRQNEKAESAGQKRRQKVNGARDCAKEGRKEKEVSLELFDLRRVEEREERVKFMLALPASETETEREKKSLVKAQRCQEQLFDS